MSIRRQCELIGLNRSTVYYTPKEPTEEYRQWIELVMEKIDYWHTRMPYLGARRLSAKLKKDDHINAGRKLVRRLMREMGIRAICPKENLSLRNFNLKSRQIIPRLGHQCSSAHIFYAVLQ